MLPGLILLWPFLGRFFRRLNLVGSKEFIDEASLMRGILLTQFLVTGKKEAPEYELALNKLLCGADMDMEIDSEIELTEEEINLSNSLLTGAITNWEKLKGTRIGTFRETFLQRNGSLYYLNNRWELKVEKKAYDLLLETLPWGSSCRIRRDREISTHSSRLPRAPDVSYAGTRDILSAQGSGPRPQYFSHALYSCA